MKKKGNHIIPVFFLLITLAPTLFMGGLQVLQFYIRQRMEAALEKESLVTITVPAAGVVWYEEGREIKVNGRMFDIESYTVKDGLFTALGIYDDEETRVVNLMNGHWSERDQQHLVVQLLVLSHCIIPLFFLLYTFGLVPFIYKPAFLFLRRYVSPALAIPIPPPWRGTFLH